MFGLGEGDQRKTKKTEMAPGAFANNGPVGDYAGGITASVVITSIVAASGGAIFGYDIGISGALCFLSLLHSLADRLLLHAKINHSLSGIYILTFILAQNPCYAQVENI